MSLLGSAAAGIVLAGPGQFGFVHSHKLAFCDVEPSSFTIAGTKFIMGPDRTGYVVTNLSRHQKTLAMRPAVNSPVRLVYETAAEGFTMDVRGGLQLKANIDAPFVSWSEGSVGPGIPSAPSTWVLLSWQSARPPVFLSFGGKQASVMIEETGEGFILDVPKFSGVVRVRFPFGLNAKSAANAWQLGALVEQVTPQVPRLLRSPHAVDFTLVESERGLLATWLFDAPGAMLPAPLVAGLKGGRIKLLSPKKQVLSGAFVSESKEISALFLNRRLLPGLRFVRNATSAGTMADGGSYADVARASVDYLCGNWSGSAETALLTSRATYVSELQFTKDPLSANLVPFEANGGGSAMAASYALAAGAMDEPATWLNGLLSSLDWVSWMPMGATFEEQRDAAALLAVTCAFRNEPEARLIGAMANCGAGPNAPFAELRDWLYPGPKQTQYPWLPAMQSPIRVLSKSMSLIDLPGVGFSVSGVVDSLRSFDVIIDSDQPLRVVKTSGIEQALVIGETMPTVVRVKPAAAGPWSLHLARKSPGLPIPTGAPSPRYSASPR